LWFVFEPPFHRTTHTSSATHPSRTALPKGRVEELPPRNKFQIVSANADACESDEKPTAPVAPPRDSVTILPLDWQKLMSDASAWQFGRAVPENVVLSVGLQVCYSNAILVRKKSSRTGPGPGPGQAGRDETTNVSEIE
jgi:hypothetical protein